MKNKQGGFLQLIIFIIILVLVMSYFQVTLKEAILWFLNALRNIF